MKNDQKAVKMPNDLVEWKKGFTESSLQKEAVPRNLQELPHD